MQRVPLGCFPVGEKTEKLDFLPYTNILHHMAIQGLLA